MQGLEYKLSHVMSPGEKKQLPYVVFIKAPRELNWVFLWAADAVLKLLSKIFQDSVPRQSGTDSRLFTVITRDLEERDVLVQELGRLGQLVAFLDSEGIIRGHCTPDNLGFLVFYEMQVTGISFERLILLDGGVNAYRSWSRMVGMARRSLHIITTDPLASGHWEEPDRHNLISCSYETPHEPSQRERLRKAGLLKKVEIFDIHDLLKKYRLGNHGSPDPRVLERLLENMLEEEEEQRLHIAFDDAPVHPIGHESGDTKWLTGEWEDILGSLSSNASLVSLTIAFQPYIRYATTTFDVREFKNKFQLPPEKGVNIIIQEGSQDVGFPNLLDYVLLHESPQELRVKHGVLNTNPRPSCLVSGEKPILITPPSRTHYHHQGVKCDGRHGRKCVAMTAADYLHFNERSGWKENVVVLISDGEILENFTSTSKDKTVQIHHPRDFRGMEISEVMCVGVEDSWVVEGISRAIRTLFIVDGGTHLAAKNRMKLWLEMERRGLLLHRPLKFYPPLRSSLDDSEAFLNQQSHTLKVLFPEINLHRAIFIPLSRYLQKKGWKETNGGLLCQKVIHTTTQYLVSRKSTIQFYSK
ncbi:unnamed protein product [Darwinula stevensoni]|uniref:Uncharacterized protein n=1 Tax=Darwinula stevensoni TaxID=69355 RepID=A0A7R9FR84_9CRUS|nr:unnamed protein product [Darwinula stevensoni]CAG0900510.1 unnamed protein product [Darwinula stevensoni]